MTYISRNPFTRELVAEYRYATEDELNVAIKQSYDSFQEWRLSSISLRSDLLSRLAEILIAEKEDHAKMITAEMGKPIRQALGEVEKSATACRYYATEMESMLEPRLVGGKDSQSKILFEPLGTILAIMPWNFPYWQVIRCLAPALAAGNSIILKHASNVPGCAMKIEESCLKAGFPKGLFQNLFLDHKQTATLISNPIVRSLSLTGSNFAGEKIAALAGSVTKKCVLELGGSDPFIVFNDADLSKAAEAAVTGRFQNNGQSCIAAKRLFVQYEVYDEFIKLFSDLVKELKMGDPMDMSTDIGPLVNPEAVIELQSIVEKSLSMGAQIRLGSPDSSYGPNFFEPMIVENAPDDSPIATEETFGPLIPVFRFSEYEELVMRVNKSIFGLGSSVWTSNNLHISNLSKDLETGTLAINGFTRSDPSLPFGGVKSSGYGRELSVFGLMEFVNIKTVSIFS